jgi:hypothetical protein
MPKAHRCETSQERLAHPSQGLSDFFIAKSVENAGDPIIYSW